MIISDAPPTIETVKSQPPRAPLPAPALSWARILLCLLLACVGASWFVYQLTLVPQPARFAPHWQGAQWLQATDDNASLAYFRYAYQLNALPDGAFVTVAANQTFEIYVNNAFVASNSQEVVQGKDRQAYMYDILANLQRGTNVIAISVANLNQQTPTLKATIGIVQGQQTAYYRSGTNWQATAQSTKANLRYMVTGGQRWTAAGFDSSSWPSAKLAPTPAFSPDLSTNPALYEQPISTHWMSAGSGHEAYFVRKINLPAPGSAAGPLESTGIVGGQGEPKGSDPTVAPTTSDTASLVGLGGVWLRITATGPANIFINGNQVTTWNGQVAIQQQHISSFLSDQETTPLYQNGLALGMYDLTPYFHTGVNTLAVHVETPGNTTSQVGLATLNTALLADILSSDYQGRTTWFTQDTGWHVSNQPVDGWKSGSAATLQWPAPFAIGRPGTIQAIYLPESNSVRVSYVFPLLPFLLIVLSCLLAVGVVWLLMSLLVMRHYYHSHSHALSTLCLAYLPALAVEVLLIVLSREPQLPQPFPYTWQWGWLLLALVGFGYLLLFLAARYKHLLVYQHIMATVKTAFSHPYALPPALNPTLNPKQVGLPRAVRSNPADLSASAQPIASTELTIDDYKQSLLSDYRQRVLNWLCTHWGLVLLMLIAIPLISYNLAYEPYWQDELTSYFAAKGILATGLPVLPSGFLYPKGELYSYLLALSMAIFGEQGGNLRLVSVAAYLISLPLLYRVGAYFFERKIALLATAMLAFSPFALQWGRAVRMYELAQLFTIVVVYLFFKAIQERKHPHLIYLAVGSLILTYLSHEEIFIMMPALVVCVLLASRDATHRLPAVLYQKHWWIASLLGVSIIMGQLIIAKVTHPPILGTDQSQEPLIQFTVENLPFYFKLLFLPTVLSYTQPLITINSLLAVLGCIWALRSGDSRARYCALFLTISFLTLVLIFTATADRYIYTLLPVYYLMGAYALLTALRALWQPLLTAASLSASRVGGPIAGLGQTTQTKPNQALQGFRNPVQATRLMAMATIILVCASVVLLPILPLDSYSLFLSKQAGLSYHRHYADYDDVATYVHQHWKEGDIVISVSPAISILYYVGHVDYFFSMDRALYLFEKGTAITDTPTGSHPLLNQGELETVLATHARIWLITDNGSYRSAIRRTQRFVFPHDFYIAYRGYGATVYFRGG